MRWCAAVVLLLVLIHGLPTGAALAQATDWTRVDQAASWYGAFADHGISDRASLWFDGQWRRMGVGAEPQQVLIRPGVILTVAPGVRIGAGYAWVATAPYGEAPAATPLREHRAWQQLSLSQRLGGTDVLHRYRLEQRWLSPVLAGEPLQWSYQNRARYLVRAQDSLPLLRFAGSAVLGFVWNEAFLSIGHADAAVRLTQNRLGGGIAIPLDARQRIEVGYMNLWNPLTAASVNEFNHTLTVSYLWTARR